MPDTAQKRHHTQTMAGVRTHAEPVVIRTHAHGSTVVFEVQAEAHIRLCSRYRLKRHDLHRDPPSCTRRARDHSPSANRRGRYPHRGARHLHLDMVEELHEALEVSLRVVDVGEVTAVRAVVVSTIGQLMGHRSQVGRVHGVVFGTDDQDGELERA